MNQILSKFCNFIGLFLFHFVVIYGQNPPQIEEYCPLSIFEPKCSPGELIAMDRAAYGIIKVGQCIEESLKAYTGCFSDELQYFDEHCSGRQTCSVPINLIPEIIAKLTCLPKWLSPYLEASFSCVKVNKIEDKCNSPKIMNVANEISRIFSKFSKKSSCGLQTTPYVIKAKPGQQLNISLLDFSWSESEEDQPCSTYGYILESENDNVITICGNRERFKHIYTSSSNQIQIILEESKLYNNFLLEYKAFGCPEVLPPKNGFASKNHDELIIGCHSSTDKWTIKCIDNAWVGHIGECPEVSITTEGMLEEDAPNENKDIQNDGIISHHDMENPKISISRNHVLVVTIGCITLILCSVIVIVGIYFIKKNQKKIKDTGVYQPYEVYNLQDNGTVTYRSNYNGTMESNNIVMPMTYTLQPVQRNGQLPDIPVQNNV